MESQLAELVSRALAAQPAVDHWPQTAGVPVATVAGAARRLQFEHDLLRLAGLSDLAGKSVLDVGSGFGVSLIVYALLGAAAVHGIEYAPEAVRAVELYLPELPQDVAARIHNRSGDAAKLPYSEASFDVVLSVEAISHYANPSAFLDEAGRVLKPGGVLIIADGNNGANPRIVRETQEIWRAFEEGADGTRIGEHQVRTSYRAMRREIVSNTAPELDPDTAQAIARGTAGFTSEQVIEAVRRFQSSGDLPHSVYNGGVPLSPSGMAMERLFDPRELAREVERRGFHAKALGYWGGAGGRPLVRTANRLLTAASPLTLRFARAFRVVGRRR